MQFVVAVGTTRRLVDARDAKEARLIFLRDVPRGTVLASPEYERVQVYAASEQNLIEFASKKRRPVFEEQLALPLNDRHAGPGKHKKEHA